MLRSEVAKPQSSSRRKPPATPLVASDALPPLPVSILYRGEVVGASLLEYPLDAPGAIAGRLTPGAALRRVSHVFGLYVLARGRAGAALERFIRERDALGLRLVDRDGDEIDGAVDLISDWGDGRWVVHLQLGAR